MNKTLELEEKMKEAVAFNYKFYVENKRFPKTTEDPYYRSARRYFDGAENYRKQVLIRNGFTEQEAEMELNKNAISKEELFESALKMYKEQGVLWYGSELVDEYFGCLFYIRKAVLKELGYSDEDVLYEIKEQVTMSATPLKDVLQPLIQWIQEIGEVPRSYEFEERGTIVRRFGKWDIALNVAMEYLDEKNTLSIDELYRKHRDRYLPNVETLTPLKEFIVENNRLPKTSEIKDYIKINREYIIWDNALDEAMADLGYSMNKRMDLFRNR